MLYLYKPRYIYGLYENGKLDKKLYYPWQCFYISFINIKLWQFRSCLFVFFAFIAPYIQDHIVMYHSTFYTIMYFLSLFRWWKFRKIYSSQRAFKTHLAVISFVCACLRLLWITVFRCYNCCLWFSTWHVLWVTNSFEG